MVTVGLIASLGWALGSAAGASPFVVYTPSSGNLKIVNDTTSNLKVANLKSADGYFTKNGNDSIYAWEDFGDLPKFIVYLGGYFNKPNATFPGLPPGVFDVGNVVKPYTFINDLAFDYHFDFPSPPTAGEVRYVPEPTGVGLALIGLIAAIIAARYRVLSLSCMASRH